MSIKTSERLTLLFVSVVCSVILAIIAFGSVYSRYIADDYCVKAALRKADWLTFVVSNYTGWTGTFSALALHGVMPSAQTLVIPIVLWFFVGFVLLYLAVSALLERVIPAAASRGLLSIAVASLFYAVFMTSLLSLHQALFWYVANAHYLFPLALVPLSAISVFKVQTAWSTVLLFILHFILAGFNSLFMAFQVSLLSLGVLATLRFPKLRVMLFVGLLGALLGTAVVVMAPGNAVRAAQLGMSPDLLAAISNSLAAAVYPVAYAARQAPLGVISAFGLSAIFAYCFSVSLIRKRLHLFAVLVVTFLSVASAFLPSFYAFAKLPAPRGWTTPIWITLLGVMALGYVYGVIFRRDQPPLGYLPLRAQIAVVILTFGFALNGVPIALQAVSRQAAYAAAWDERDAYLRSLSGSTETVRARSFHGAFNLEDITDDPTYWTNSCIASYYNLNVILPDDQPPFVP